MRRLGTLADAEAARGFADLLRIRGIAAEFRTEAGGIAVWVRDEDQLPAARDALAALGAEPAATDDDAPRQAAPTQPDPVPDPPPSTPRAKRPPVWRRAPLTIALIAACVLATLWTNFG